MHAFVALVALLYYFVVSSELKMALRLIAEGLMRVEKRFEKVEMSFDEDIKILKCMHGVKTCFSIYP